MKHLFTLLIALSVLYLKSFSQTDKTKLLIGAGISFNGTGDALGYGVLNEVDIAIGKLFFLSPGIQLNTHSKTQTINIYQLHNVTTGLNLFTNINFKILNSGHHIVALGIGPVLRLQTTSEPSTVYYSMTPTGENRLTIRYDDPTKTVAVGYNVMPSYYYQINTKLCAGLKAVIQDDARGDLISTGFLFVGITF